MNAVVRHSATDDAPWWAWLRNMKRAKLHAFWTDADKRTLCGLAHDDRRSKLIRNVWAKDQDGQCKRCLAVMANVTLQAEAAARGR